MTYRAVTIHLPQEIYQQARRIARLTQRPVEQVVVDWIQPPESAAPDEQVLAGLRALDDLSDDELIQVARSVVPLDNTRRLQELLAAQREQELSEAEQREAAALVEQEDRHTLRKARALFLLKQRGALPADLIALLVQMAPSRPYSFRLI